MNREGCRNTDSSPLTSGSTGTSDCHSNQNWSAPAPVNDVHMDEDPHEEEQRKSLVTPSQSTTWKGIPLDEIKLPNPPVLPPLCASAEHKIFFDYTKCDATSPRVPYPDKYVDKWCDGFVRLPCSPESVYPLYGHGQKSLVSRWTLIEETLRKPMKSVTDLSEAILAYNSRFRSTWSFSVLHSIVTDGLLPDGDEATFFNHTLPAMCALALNLPVYLTKPIPLMRRDTELSLTFSQMQIASLLANAFFCTFPRRNSRAKGAEFSTYPAINFSSLFSAPPGQPKLHRNNMARKQEKIRCLLHYFHRITQSPPKGTVTYTRRCLGDRVPKWSESSRSFDQLRVHINAVQTIEDAGSNSLQVDFANRYLGGGVLRTGCVQEEIMFVLRPELLVAGLFIEQMGKDETVIIEGSECFSASSGYAETFRWVGDYRQEEHGAKRDEWGRWDTFIVAMDATRFTQRARQYTPECINRELNKAYCGFTDELAPHRKLPTVVATGNWGCGAFRGNVDLKSLIQMLACLEAGKSMAYFTFRDQALCERLYGMYEFLASNKITVGALWNVLNTLDTSVSSQPDTLYDYLKQRLLP